MLKTGITERNYCNKYGFEKGLEIMRLHGYEGIDYQELAFTTSSLFKKNFKDFETYLKVQGQKVKDAGLMVHQVHGPCSWAIGEATRGEREKRMEYMKQAIEGTAILESSKFVVHPFFPFDTGEEISVQQSFEINVDLMGRLADIAKEYDITVCFENMPFRNFSLSSPEAVLKVIQEVRSDYLKVCLDTGHCIIMGIQPGEAVRLLGKDNLCAMHIHDNNGERDLHLEPFLGIIDWMDFTKALHEISFEGVISLEVDLPKNLPEELISYEEVGLLKKAQYIAERADGKQRFR